MQIIIFKRQTDKQFLKTLQVLNVKSYFGSDAEGIANIGIFDKKLAVFHGFN